MTKGGAAMYTTKTQRLILFSVAVAAALAFVAAPRAAAQAEELNEDIDLVLQAGFRHVSQRNHLWKDYLIGPNQDVTMGPCGCLLAVLSAVLENSSGLGFPWFVVPPFV